MQERRNLVCHDVVDDSFGLVGTIVVILIVLVLAVLAILTIVGLIGGFYAIKNYVISFKDNVIMDNWKKKSAEAAWS